MEELNGLDGVGCRVEVKWRKGKGLRGKGKGGGWLV
jgi:hypothetical protein